MAIPQFTDDINIIQKLADEPNDDNGLSADELKAKFDEAGVLFKKYINEKLLPSISAMNTPFTSIVGVEAQNVQEAIAALYEQLTNAVIEGLVPDGTIGTVQLANNAVTGAKLAEGAVTADKMAAELFNAKADVVGGKVAPAQASAAIVSVSGDKTLALEDAGTIQRCENASSMTLTIPTDASVAFPVGTEIEVYRANADVVVSTESGVTIECAESGRKVADKYSRACLKKWATNRWSLEGNVG